MSNPWIFRSLPAVIALSAVSTPACTFLTDWDALSNGEGGAGGAGGTGGNVSDGGGTVSTGTAGGGILKFRDDELDGEFGSGTFESTTWDGASSASGSVALTNLPKGSFTSRVFDAGDIVSWLTLEWAPKGPYGKPLPDNGEKETYPEGSADMTSNVLLLHLDGMGSVAPGGKLSDSSGLGYYATAVQSSMSFTEGRFFQAIDDGPDNYIYVGTNTSPELAFGTDDFTWSIWVRSTEDCAGNKVQLGVDDGSGDTPHLWLGCTDSGETGCPGGATGGRAGAVLKSAHQTDATAFVCGTTRINDGVWHQLTLVKTGFPDVGYTLYVDGSAEATKQVTWAKPIAYTTDPELAIGAFSDGTYPAEGDFDEVAIWRRELSASEVRGIFLRGALRLSFQVRGCALPECADNPAWVGPGGATTSAFVATTGTSDTVLVPIDATSESGEKQARYFQYRATFESDALPAVPALLSVELTAE